MFYPQSRSVQLSRREIDWSALVAATLLVSIASILAMMFA